MATDPANTRAATTGSAAIRILDAQSREQLDAFRTLCGEYAADVPFVSVSLAHQGFENEIAALPGLYAPPRGCILLAMADRPAGSELAGCVALRPLAGPQVCEMKRMFVRPRYRGLGVGHALGQAVVARTASAMRWGKPSSRGLGRPVTA